MPANPYLEDEAKRRAQINMLGAGIQRPPVSTTMPVGNRSGQRTIENGGFVDPITMDQVRREGTMTPDARRESSSPPTWHVQPRGRAPAGFDQRNWDDPAMQTVKYRAGRLLHDVRRPSDLAQRVQSEEFQRAFPGATFDGKDRINFAGALAEGDSGDPVFDIDVLLAADRDADTSNGLWWGPLDAGAGAPAAASERLTPGLTPGMDNSALARILAELSAASEGEQSPAEREALLALLQGGV